MKSIILSDTPAAGQIFSAVSDFVTPLSQTPNQMVLKNKQGERVFVSSHLWDLPSDAIVLVNSDETLTLCPSFESSHPVITYGCNPKATVTASSISETKMICCIQRTLELEDMPHILPQEFSVSIGPQPITAYLAAICILLLCFGESYFSFEN